MFAPNSILGMVFIATALSLSHCRSHHDADDEGANRQEDPTKHAAGICINENSFLCITGNTHELLFRCLQHEKTSWKAPVTATLSRLHPGPIAQPLVFPSRFRVHEQSFKEGNVTYFLTTGYVARKRLLFHRVRCDHPGALHVKATMAPHGQVKAQKIEQDPPHASHLWLLPLEAEVVSDNRSLVIESEGELLLLWHFPQAGDNESPSWQRLVGDYDAGSEEQPDLTIVADALHADAARSED
ncbi:MAG: hypothetical protein RI957_1573 [Verrucomicrobiota bacterium]|jgi:hypothetical protein